MNVDVKAQWVAALRSGGYQRCRGRLCTGNLDSERSYCCLGVLCELAADAGVVTRRDELTRGRVTYVDEVNDDLQWSHLPLAVRRWASVAVSDPVVRVTVDGDVQPITLSYLNDNRGLTFDEVADLVEEQL